uniref:Beta-lactamase n=1 Tax=uncultured bacterium AOCarb3 TaxID=654974 RepID=D6MLV4_9BACT|nr:Crb3 [uncultured bacterium AOCarb3]
MTHILARAIIFTAFFISVFGELQAQEKDVKDKIEQIIDRSNGNIGVGVFDFASGLTVLINNAHQFPMQSVFKFPLGMAVLDMVDRGKLKLDQQVYVSKNDLQPTYSPLRDKFPDGNVNVTLADLLTYSVSLSDNNACDILFRLVGGTQVVNDYIRGLGIKDMAIVATEMQMSKGWDVQFENYSTPEAMLDLLKVFQSGKKLSASSSGFLWKIMTESPTGLKRIKGKLPSTAKVTHKTGTSGKNHKGITAATNDVGIMTLPNGNQIAIVVFVSNSEANETAREMVIADIAKVTWDEFSAK